LRQIAMAERLLGAEAAAELRSRMSARIVGGETAGANTHPFQVGLLFKAQPDNFQAQYCGGTLIKPNVVVTAAHCSDFVTKDEVQVLTGTQRLNGSGTRRNVRNIKVHPDWNPASSNDSDIAIWFLSSNASGIPLATLATDEPPNGTDLMATGWGGIRVQPGDPQVFAKRLRQVKLPLFSRTKCRDAYNAQFGNGTITGNMICAGFNAGGKDTCQVDSGGPLTRRKNGTFKVLTGVTSFGAGCALAGFPGVYTRVSRFRNWINNQIN
jgi:secreted trypsin-like serine protease